MIISRSQLSPTEEGPAHLATEEEHNWLLNNLPNLPMFSQVKEKVCTALRQVRDTWGLMYEQKWKQF